MYGIQVRTRKYQLKRRAERHAETRRRIIEATAELHRTLGPAHTSILAIAKRAGVERPTVYRHFPTVEALFTACTAHHWANNPLPDPEAWLAIESPTARLQQALREYYAYYMQHEVMLWNVQRDLHDHPEFRRFGAHRLRHIERAMEVLTAVWPTSGENHLLKAAIAHSIDFFAWRSLHQQGLTDDEIVQLMIGFMHSAVHHNA
jgi:AcrR family transcriptional regulator